MLSARLSLRMRLFSYLSFPLFASALFANSDGADPGHTGAPGEQVCTACHSGTANSGRGRVQITLGSGATWTPGARVRIEVQVEDPTARRWGFQLTARSSANAQQTAGTLAASDNQTQLVSQAGRQYVTHTATGTRNGTTGSVRFGFDWTAPAADFGPVTFYAAGNAANGNGSNSGDSIYTVNLQAAPASAGGGGPRPTFRSDSVSDLWTGKAGMAAGAWVNITGTELASQTANWSPRAGQPLPTALGGVTVKVNEVPAALSFVSATRVTLLVPAATPDGNVPVVVERGGTASESVSVAVTPTVPAIQAVPDPATAGRFYAAVTPAGAGTALVFVNPRGWVLGKPEVDNRAARGAFPGEEIDIWATGLGKAEDTPTDRLFTGSFPVATPPRVRFGELAVDAIAATLVAPGLYNVRVRVPESLARLLQLAAESRGRSLILLGAGCVVAKS